MWREGPASFVPRMLLLDWQSWCCRGFACSNAMGLRTARCPSFFFASSVCRCVHLRPHEAEATPHRNRAVLVLGKQLANFWRLLGNTVPSCRHKSPWVLYQLARGDEGMWATSIPGYNCPLFSPGLEVRASNLEGLWHRPGSCGTCLGFVSCAVQLWHMHGSLAQNCTSVMIVFETCHSLHPQDLQIFVC